MRPLKEVDNNVSGHGSERLDAQGFSTKHMDNSFDPFEDFFEYSSGTWSRNNPVPPDKSSWNSFMELNESNTLKLREILETCTGKGVNGNSAEKMLGSFYTSAINMEKRNKAMFKPISGFMDSVEEIDSLNSLVHNVSQLHANGIYPFFEISSRTDEKNSSFYGLYIDQGGLSLPDRDYYISEEFRDIREKYLNHIEKVFSMYGHGKEEAHLAAETVLSVETEIAKASRSRAELRDAEKNYNRIQFSDIDGKFLSLNLKKYLENLKSPALEYIIAGQPEFLEFLDSSLPRRSLEDLKTYLKWNILNASASFLFSELEDEHFDMFVRTILGQKEQEPRWKRAIRVIDHYVGEALGEIYVQKYFTSEARERMSLMVNDIRSVFLDRLQNLEWMKEETRKRAIAKFEKFRTKIGHPEKFKDYSSVEVRSEDYFGNVCRASAFEIRRQMERAGKPVDKDEWFMTPSTVNAYFSPPDNEIVFPAGILQPPFFDTSVDVAVNYGAIGAVISHEITHGYDDQGRRYDENGNIMDWWTKEDEESFMSRAEAVKELYSSMEVLPGLYVNGELTLGENIADFGGVSIAYEALQKRLKREPELRKSIDGLTPEQRFYISYGQIWKQNIREPMVKFLVTIDPHAPNRFRATLPVYCHSSFDEAFSSESKKEKPVCGKKIEIW